MNDERIWQAKLAARIHDPGEKPLILMRTREGHEGGTVRALREAFFPGPNGIPKSIEQIVKRADWWSAAADRPQWPRTLNDQIFWTKEPVLIHPISGNAIDLRQFGGLDTIEPAEIAAKSLAHFESLREAVGGDLKKSLLAFWRFGPEIIEENDSSKLGALWQQLPADTRVPDHSIWEHLDLASAFAGAFAADDRQEVALLAFAIGPVQPFIAAARKMDDLWAGSHLLAHLAWEAMKPLVERLGPDAVLFPRLRGIPQVDLWLIEQGLPEQWFENTPWHQSANADTNPLFVASLPNRFVALVPASQARALAERCCDAVRNRMQKIGEQVVTRLLEVANIPIDPQYYCFEQARSQLAGFPEVYWAAVPFSLIGTSADDGKVTDTVQLSAAMAPFFEPTEVKPGFLGSPAWEVLSGEIKWQDQTRFYVPNPGVLYPAVYDLAERVLAATKAARTFGQLEQSGWRDSLTGEAEWLTDNPDHLTLPAGKRKSRKDKHFQEGEHFETLWTKIADEKPAWAKKGEHLSVLSAIKRLWPTLFAEEAGKALKKQFGRFVVSTHTMALAYQLDRWLEHGGLTATGFTEAAQELKRERVALPTRLMLRHREHPALPDARTLLAMMEEAQDTDDAFRAEHLQRLVRNTLAQAHSPEQQSNFRLETYYGLLLMDGDRMGALLSEGGRVTFRESFHPTIRKQFDQLAKSNEMLKRYGDTVRPPSPGRHMAISSALNDFALHVVPHIVQREYLGRLIYGGGDDVFAILPVADLLFAAARLRDAWWGENRFHKRKMQDTQRNRLQLGNGYALLDGKLLRMMGKCATASAGLVVAHHQAPFGAVLRELHAAEQRAKHEGGRNAFSLTLIKRSGGALYLTAQWHRIDLLLEAIEYFAAPETSRRAAYHSLHWLTDLPEPSNAPEMVASLLAYQLARQSGGDTAKRAPDLARKLTEAAREENPSKAWLSNFLSVAEFLAREVRMPIAPGATIPKEDAA